MKTRQPATGPVVYCLCGKIGSGKSTLARKLAETEGAVIFNLDRLMEPLFGQTLGRERYVHNLKICRDYVYGLADQVLDRGVSVVFDFGFWERAERQFARERFAGRRVVFLLCPVGEEEQRRRVFARNRSDDKTYAFTGEMLETLNRFFEDPLPEEGLVWGPTAE